MLRNIDALILATTLVVDSQLRSFFLAKAELKHKDTSTGNDGVSSVQSLSQIIPYKNAKR
jgi:hypothetical protein